MHGRVDCEATYCLPTRSIFFAASYPGLGLLPAVVKILSGFVGKVVHCAE